jgi:hypothetical protein
MDSSVIDKATAFDKNGVNKKQVDNAISCLKEFRTKFPFTEDSKLIATLRPDDIFKEPSDEVGEFFHYLEYYFKPLGHSSVRDSSLYRNIRLQIEDFKNLLNVVVDKNKSWAKKVDANWGKIKGLGDDKQLAKKIVFCFNYESGKGLPILSIGHLKHFLGKIADKPDLTTKYYTLGEEYECLTSELLKAKKSLPIMQGWEITYFTRFLYENYSPPDREVAATNLFGERKSKNVVTRDQLELGEFVNLLGELQRNGKISGEKFRVNRELWINQPQERNALIKRLKAQLT